MAKKREHKPIIETIINTTALTLTATGTQWILNNKYIGFALILFGAGLEFFKYWGRKNNYW